MKQIILVLALSIFPFLLLSTYDDTEVDDPLGFDSRLELVHLYDRFPVGVAVSATGRKFTCFPGGLDANNTGKVQVTELTGLYTEIAYPNVSYNSPPGGPVDFTKVPPVTKGLSNYLLSVESLWIDDQDTLWLLDAGRVVFNGVMLESSYGGPKLISVNLQTNTTIQTYVFARTVVGKDSYLGDVRVDTERNYAYLPDFSPEGNNAIVVLNLASGESWRVLEHDPSVTAEYGFVPFVFGHPLYMIQTNPLGAPIAAVYISFGADSVALSPDLETLYFSTVAQRMLYSVPTSLLRNRTTPPSEIAAAVSKLGQKGFAVGLASDSLGFVYSGNNEQDAVSMYNPSTEKTVIFVRDKRLNFVAKLFPAFDGYLYFDVTQFPDLPSVYRGEGPLIPQDRRKPPYMLYRIKLEGGAAKGRGG